MNLSHALRPHKVTPATTRRRFSRRVAIVCTATLAATASDPSGVSAVKWFVDGREVAYDANGAPWTATYNTKLSSNGSHSVFVKARDRLGNWGTSPITTVRLAN